MKLPSAFYSQWRHLSSKICIVGSGPAGFYCAQRLCKVIPDVMVDIYEKLPVPFGLIRFGVAPDHPDIKNVINTFNKVAISKQVRFIGNVSLGKDVSLLELKNSYHAVVLAYGAECDIKLDIPGENLNNVISAKSFVGWYNGLPSEKNLSCDFNADVVSIIGQGNVAVDVARILLKSVDDLKCTDMTEYALNALSKSKIKRVNIIGRRGPLQAAFTIKEFREITKIPNVATIFQRDQMEGLEKFLPDLPRPRKRLTELLLKTCSQPNETYDKSVKFIFLRSPVHIIGSTSVERLALRTNMLSQESFDSQKAVPTDEVETIASELVFKSTGYQSVQVDPDIPFDGRRMKKNSCVPGVYGVGWLSMGPVGVILHTMGNAYQVADRIADDFNKSIIKRSESKPGYENIAAILGEKGVAIVDWAGWLEIDKIETERGQLRGKPREKIVNTDDMIEIAHNN